MISVRMKEKKDNVLADFLTMENLSVTKVQKYSLRKPQFIACPDYVAPFDTTIKQLINHKYDKCAEALKEEIIKDIVDAVYHLVIRILLPYFLNS